MRRSILRACLLAAMTALVSAAMLCGGEAILRAIGYGHSTDPMIRRSFRGHTFLSANKAFYQQFFSLPVERLVDWPEFEYQVPEEKAEDSCRILVLGASAALGMPPDAGCSFSRVLEVLLRAQYPNTRFEILNAAFPGANSHTMRAVARFGARLKPDVIIVYMGNNEMVGPFGATSVLRGARFWSRPVIRASIALQGCRLLQWARGNARGPQLAPEPERDDTVTRDDPRAQRVYEFFRDNLEDICEAGLASGSQVVLCSVGSNLRDWPPLRPCHRFDLSPEDLSRWEELFAAGKERQEAGAFQEALLLYGQAAEIDGDFAALAYVTAQCHEALGRVDEARKGFTLARDLDGYRTRADSGTLAIITDTASGLADRGVLYVDAAALLASASSGGIPGREMFWDNVHLTFEGNYVLAGALAEKLDPALRGEQFAVPLLSREECARQLGVNAAVLKIHAERILRDYHVWHHHSTEHLEAMIADLAQTGGDPQQAYCADEGASDFLLSYRCVQELLLAGQVDASLEKAKSLVDEHPTRLGSAASMALCLGHAGRFDEAEALLKELLTAYPDESETPYRLAIVLRGVGRHEKALEWFGTACRINPYHELARCGEGQTLELMGRPDEAQTKYEQAISMNPHHPEPYARLSALVAPKKTPQDVADLWRDVAERHTGAAPAQRYLGAALEAVGDRAGAAAAYRAACEIDPNDGEARQRLEQLNGGHVSP